MSVGRTVISVGAGSGVLVGARVEVGRDAIVAAMLVAMIASGGSSLVGATGAQAESRVMRRNSDIIFFMALFFLYDYRDGDLAKNTFSVG